MVEQRPGALDVAPQEGEADHISATVAATCGLAIEVPDFSPYPLPGNAERMSTPGAEMFGLISPFSPGPLEEKYAILPSASKAPAL